MKSWKGEVIADNSGKFCGNGLRFATQKEAQIYIDDLEMRWILVRETRVVESDDPVNYRMQLSKDETGEWWQFIRLPDATPIKDFSMKGKES